MSAAGATALQRAPSRGRYSSPPGLRGPSSSSSSAVMALTSVSLSLSVFPLSSWGPDLRAQLTEQMKILDCQVEVKQQQLSDLSDFLRRRGDIEAEYARALDKLTERFTHKTKK